MKKIILATIALSATSAFAVDVDYSRCRMYAGVELNHEGRVQSNAWQKIKSQRTEGNKEFLVLESPGYNGNKFELQVTLERDAQGRVIKSTMGGETPTQDQIKQYREMMVNGAVMMGPGMMQMQGQGGFMSSEPTYFVRKRTAPALAPGETARPFDLTNRNNLNTYGMDPNYELVPLSRLTQDQAREAGIENGEELRRLRSQWRRDRRTTDRIRDGYRQVVGRSALAIPMGTENEFDIQDGVCLPKKSSSRVYNSLSGQVNTYPTSSRENCDKIKTIYQRHERKINECNQASQQVTNDYFREMYQGLVGGSGSGSGSSTNTPNSAEGTVGGAVHGGFYGGGLGLAGGMAGGYMGGFPGMGLGGAFGGFGGYGMMGMMNPYGMMGADMNSIAAQNMMCEWTYHAEQQRQPVLRQDGTTSGSGSGSETNQQ